MTSTHMPRTYDSGARRFGRVNWIGLVTLIKREVMRFLSVWQQTVFAPLMTATLFVIVFALAFGTDRGGVMGLPYLQFLAPGILMMTVIQNAFANTSSSIISAKMQGNIVDTLMPPLSAGELVTGYLLGSVLRVAIVGAVITLGIVLVLGHGVKYPVWAVLFMLLAALFMGALGMMAGIIAQKFDQMATITNFVVQPLSFLSGTFYSIEVLSPPFYIASRFNPIFYMIDGVRYGFTGVSDASPWLGLGVSIFMTAIVISIVWYWLRIGYRMKP